MRKGTTTNYQQEQDLTFLVFKNETKSSSAEYQVENPETTAPVDGGRMIFSVQKADKVWFRRLRKVQFSKFFFNFINW